LGDEAKAEEFQQKKEQIESDAPIIKEIEIEFAEDIKLSDAAVLGCLKTKIGDRATGGRLDSDLKSLNQSGLIDHATFLTKPVDGGIPLIVQVKAAGEQPPKKANNLPEIDVEQESEE